MAKRSRHFFLSPYACRYSLRSALSLDDEGEIKENRGNDASRD